MFWLVVAFLFSFVSSAPNLDIKVVHVIFANHLDVGFNAQNGKSGFAIDVINRYFDVYFPQAVALTKLVPEQPGNKKYIYTSHPWLITLYLNCSAFSHFPGELHCPNPTQRNDFIEAVKSGGITWHAFPFNAQISLMNPQSIKTAVSIGHQLNKEFNQPLGRTLSQRDVPGITVGALRALHEAGVEAISVGVNGASAPPGVPKVFLWKTQPHMSPEYQMIGMWHPGGYGGPSVEDCVIVDGLPHALAMPWGEDNAGPGTLKDVMGTFQTLQKEFPNAQIIASTFDAFLLELKKVQQKLPIQSVEIGDSWIYGVSSDPYKTQLTREMMRFREQNPTENFEFDRLFIKSFEHTWGLDVKTFLRDFQNWSNSDFEKSRSGPNYIAMETSWTEQRQYLENAIQALSPSEQEALQKSILALKPPANQPNLDGFTKVEWKARDFQCDMWTIRVSPTGGLEKLQYRGKDFASPEHVLGQFLYTSFTDADYAPFMKQYPYIPSASWLAPDFGKPNVTLGKPIHGTWTPSVNGTWRKETLEEFQFYINAPMPPSPVQLGGSPRVIWLFVRLHKTKSIVDFDIYIYDKTPTRLPEAHWVSFKPLLTGNTQDDQWRINKAGELVDPILYVAVNGSKHLHGQLHGIDYHNPSTSTKISFRSPDISLVSLGAPNPFPTPLDVTPNPRDGIYWNIFNNIWGTNYIMWYPYKEQDNNGLYRFQLEFP